MSELFEVRIKYKKETTKCHGNIKKKRALKKENNKLKVQKPLGKQCAAIFYEYTERLKKQNANSRSALES